MSEDDKVARAKLRLRMLSPFFAALLMFARLEARPGLGSAATDGRTIFYDPAFFAALGAGGIEAVLMHEVLHCALRHPGRKGHRDPIIWNYAADIVVNGMIVEHGQYALPTGAIRYPELERFAVEEVYELLLSRGARPPEGLPLDLLSPQMKAAEEKAYWPAALRNARLIATSLGGMRSSGDIPGGLDREATASAATQLDWRSLMWRFLVRTPTDFEGFDRRFIGEGLYLDAMEGEGLDVSVAVDTSGSVGEMEMSLFLGEVAGVLGAYPHVRCQLYYADADLYGPYELTRGARPPVGKGGGGTSFRLFFEAIARLPPRSAEMPCVYLTDGFGDFPERAPRHPVLWVVTLGGLEDKHFPFGEVVRLRGRSG